MQTVAPFASVNQFAYKFPGDPTRLKKGKQERKSIHDLHKLGTYFIFIFFHKGAQHRCRIMGCGNSRGIRMKRAKDTVGYISGVGSLQLLTIQSKFHERRWIP